MPTFIIYKNKQIVEKIQGADPHKLVDAVNKLVKLAAETDGAGGPGEAEDSGGTWVAFSAPRGYVDVTGEIEIKGLDMLNSDSQFGAVRDLFAAGKPSSLTTGKRPADSKSDWVETDTDEQLMLFIPFMSSMKVHSLHVTSLPDKDDSDAPMRPKTLKIYVNRANILGFDEAEDVEATQEITLNDRDWDEKTGTAKVELRFVKFQNVKSLVLFVIDGDGDGDKVRVDRLRFLGESGEKRDQGKLTKVGEE